MNVHPVAQEYVDFQNDVLHDFSCTLILLNIILQIHKPSLGFLRKKLQVWLIIFEYVALERILIHLTFPRYYLNPLDLARDSFDRILNIVVLDVVVQKLE